MYYESRPKKLLKLTSWIFQKKFKRGKNSMTYTSIDNIALSLRILGHSEIHRAFAFLSATTSMTSPMTRTTGTTTMRPSPARGCWLQTVASLSS